MRTIVDEKCFRIYSDRFPLCWFEGILMLARNDMINEGSRTIPITGARKVLIRVKVDSTTPLPRST
jgi:hypothetical protein